MYEFKLDNGQVINVSKIEEDAYSYVLEDENGVKYRMFENEGDAKYEFVLHKLGDVTSSPEEALDTYGPRLVKLLAIYVDAVIRGSDIQQDDALESLVELLGPVWGTRIGWALVPKEVGEELKWPFWWKTPHGLLYRLEEEADGVPDRKPEKNRP